MRTLVLGGARSGKSAFAEQLVITTDCLYVATARPWSDDTDFAERIHQADLVKGIAAFPPHRDLIIVSPEVGMGIIPEHRTGRLFRDELGFLNAQVAQACDQVFFVVAGLPLQLKPGR